MSRSEHRARLQRPVGSQLGRTLEVSGPGSEPRVGSGSADGADGAVRTDPGPEHEAHLSQPCGSGGPQHRSVQLVYSHDNKSRPSS